jgi:hypothetical protein
MAAPSTTLVVAVCCSFVGFVLLAWAFYSCAGGGKLPLKRRYFARARRDKPTLLGYQRNQITALQVEVSKVDL